MWTTCSERPKLNPDFNQLTLKKVKLAGETLQFLFSTFQIIDRAPVSGTLLWLQLRAEPA